MGLGFGIFVVVSAVALAAGGIAVIPLILHYGPKVVRYVLKAVYARAEQLIRIIHPRWI